MTLPPTRALPSLLAIKPGIDERAEHGRRNGLLLAAVSLAARVVGRWLRPWARTLASRILTAGPASEHLPPGEAPPGADPDGGTPAGGTWARPLEPGDEVVVYLRVAAVGTASTAHLDLIRARAASEGWVVSEVAEDRVADRTGDRPGRERALQLAAAGTARGLVVFGLKDLSEDHLELAEVLARLRSAGAHVVALTPEFSTSLSSGREAADALIRVATFEREHPQPPTPLPRQRHR
jgi:hypothetical protein